MKTVMALEITIQPDTDGYSTVEISEQEFGFTLHKTLCRSEDVAENISGAVYRITQRNLARVGSEQ